MVGKFALRTAVAATALIIQTQPGQAACTKPQLTAEEAKEIPTRNIDQRLLSKAITKQTNYYRCKHGLPPLLNDPNLTRAAEIHSENMALMQLLKHELPVDGLETVKDRFRAAKVKVRKFRAENIAIEYRMAFSYRVFLTDDASDCRFTYRETRKSVPVNSYGSLAEMVVYSWSISPRHREIMLHDELRRIGAAGDFALDGQAPCGSYYVAQEFSG